MTVSSLPPAALGLDSAEPTIAVWKMNRCEQCGRSDPSLTKWTTLCPNCGGGHAVYACRKCGSSCSYHVLHGRMLPQVDNGYCGYCYRRSLWESSSDQVRESLKRLWNVGQFESATESAQRVLNLSYKEALQASPSTSWSARFAMGAISTSTSDSGLALDV